MEGEIWNHYFRLQILNSFPIVSNFNFKFI